jgi:putative protease
MKKKTTKKPIKKVKKTVKKSIKKPAKKIVKRVIKKAKKVVKKATIKEQLVGKIIHYYDNIEVGIVEITKTTLKVGQSIHVKGTTTDFEQDVKSMQIEHQPVNEAKKGKVVGLKTKDKVREGDLVYIAQ